MVNATVSNKDKNVEKVNTLGKVSGIMLNIALTALIIGMVTCIVMSIYFCTTAEISHGTISSRAISKAA